MRKIALAVSLMAVLVSASCASASVMSKPLYGSCLVRSQLPTSDGVYVHGTGSVDCQGGIAGSSEAEVCQQAWYGAGGYWYNVVCASRSCTRVSWCGVTSQTLLFHGYWRDDTWGYVRNADGSGNQTWYLSSQTYL